MDDGSAVAFLQLNGQMMSNILHKTSGERREEMVTMIGAAFTELQNFHFSVGSSSVVIVTELQNFPMSVGSLSVLDDYTSILTEMNEIFQAVSTTSTYDLARVCCRFLKFSK